MFPFCPFFCACLGALGRDGSSIFRLECRPQISACSVPAMKHFGAGRLWLLWYLQALAPMLEGHEVKIQIKPALEVLSGDDDPDVQFFAQRALSTIGGWLHKIWRNMYTVLQIIYYFPVQVTVYKPPNTKIKAFITSPLSLAAGSILRQNFWLPLNLTLSVIYTWNLIYVWLILV